MENSKIEWTDHTFNPWIGCTKISPGCDHCYAEALSRARLGVEWGTGSPRRRTTPANWAKVRAWDRKAAQTGDRPKVFCSSLADVFDNEVPDAWRADLFDLIRSTPNLDWLLLTKRIGNAAAMLPAGYVLGNVWLGATIVNQAEANRDIPKLLATPAYRRFLSMEPLLGPVDLTWITFPNDRGGEECYNALSTYLPEGETFSDGSCTATVDWVIVGGESGPGARPMHPDWARSLRDQCAAAGVPFLFKQWGDWVPVLDRERNDPDWRADYSNIYADGGKFKWLNLAGGCGFHGERFHVMGKVGKKAAGRLLDGAEHNGRPV